MITVPSNLSVLAFCPPLVTITLLKFFFVLSNSMEFTRDIHLRPYFTHVTSQSILHRTSNRWKQNLSLGEKERKPLEEWIERKRHQLLSVVDHLGRLVCYECMDVGAHATTRMLTTVSILVILSRAHFSCFSQVHYITHGTLVLFFIFILVSAFLFTLEALLVFTIVLFIVHHPPQTFRLYCKLSAVSFPSSASFFVRD